MSAAQLLRTKGLTAAEHRKSQRYSAANWMDWVHAD
jgi:hypothetical protein